MKIEVLVVRTIILFAIVLSSGLLLGRTGLPVLVHVVAHLTIIYCAAWQIEENELRHHARQLVEGLSRDKDS